MQCLPDFPSFCALARKAMLVPVYRRLMADALTPVSAFHRLDGGLGGCLFESVIGGEKVGRYSFLAADPFLLMEARDRSVRLIRPDGSVEEFTSADPMRELQRQLRKFTAARIRELPPFVGGAVGYAGYDVIRYVESLPHPPPDDRGLPDLAFAFFDQVVVFDNVNKTLTAVVLARLDRFGEDLGSAYADAVRRLDELVVRLAAPSADPPMADIDTGGASTLAFRSDFTQDEFEAAVRRCIEYIRAGDIFQVVISQRLEVPIHVHPFEIYRSLRIVNPSPFMFYVRTPATTLVGSSPEIMVRVVDGKITVRPLAGTRPRGTSEEEDLQLEADLLADPKERAEHVMLVDLGRNDVGRVARYGTVKVADHMIVERYSHVMHISSTVTGELMPGKDAFDALRSCLPAGTLSGAPKVRAMEIIDEMEPHRRGPYAGAVGYIDYGGNMDTCIALRTIVVQGDRAYIQAGAGIVADSVPATEYAETMNKARGLLKAIEITERRCGQQGSGCEALP